jgi:hypothetical protein
MPSASGLGLGTAPHGAWATYRLRRRDARGRRQSAVEPLDALDEIRILAAPVANGKPAAGCREEEQQDDELAARIGRHGSTIPPRHPRD